MHITYSRSTGFQIPDTCRTIGGCSQNKLIGSTECNRSDSAQRSTEWYNMISYMSNQSNGGLFSSRLPTSFAIKYPNLLASSSSSKHVSCSGSPDTIHFSIIGFLKERKRESVSDGWIGIFWHTNFLNALVGTMTVDDKPVLDDVDGCMIHLPPLLRTVLPALRACSKNLSSCP